MANEELLTILRQGAQQWNAWRAKNPGIPLDLIQADLSRADLRQVNLSRAVLSGGDLSDANLFEARLQGADLYLANLTRANLIRADLRQADLTEADLTDAVLYEANLRDATLQRTNLSGTKLSGARLEKSPDPGALALKLSLIFAPCLAALDALLGLLLWGVSSMSSIPRQEANVVVILLVVGLVLLQPLSAFLMGVVASAQTGKNRAGVFTVLWTYGWLALFGALLATVLTLLTVPSDFWGQWSVGMLAIGIIALFFSGLSAGVSTLGSLVGRTFFKPAKVL